MNIKNIGFLAFNVAKNLFFKKQTNTELDSLTLNTNNQEAEEEGEILIEIIEKVKIEDILTPQVVKKEVFTFTALKNIEEILPIIYEYFGNRGLLYKEMICYGLATLFVENDRFYPIAERPSKWSTKGGKPPYDFSNYIGKLGNLTKEDAELYRGTGLIQLTGKSNYQLYDKKLNLDGELVRQGYVAGNEKHIACAIFAEFLKDREGKIILALQKRDFKLARSYVNGRVSLHWERMKEAYEKLEAVLENSIQ